MPCVENVLVKLAGVAAEVTLWIMNTSMVSTETGRAFSSQGS